MGLDELLPENESVGSSSSSSSQRSSSKKSGEDEEHVSFGKEPYRKTYKKEKWERMKRVISRDFGLNVNEVINNYPAQERHKVLHEAAIEEASDSDTPKSELWVEERCPICDKAIDDDAVELGDVTICHHHQAWIIVDELDMEDICDDSE